MARPLTIGLTGGIAAGKSEALAAFERLGAATISSDAVVHELLDSEPLLGTPGRALGGEVAPDGVVDRDRVGEIVFADPEQLSWLESQVHPLVGERIGAWLGSLPAGDRGRGRRGPAAVRVGDGGVFDTTVAVVTSDEVRRDRAEARGHALVGEREARQLTQDGEGRPRRPRDRKRRLARRPRAGAVRPGREASGMRRRARRRRPPAARRPAPSRRRGRPGRSALFGSGTFDEAIQELTLPLRHEDIIRQQADEKDVDAALIAAVIYSESKFGDQTSSAGARGLMQITPEAAKEIERLSGGTTFKLDDLSDPEINIRYGTFLLRELLDRYDGNVVAGARRLQRRPGERRRVGRQRPERRGDPLPGNPRLRRRACSTSSAAYRDEYAQELGYGERRRPGRASAALALAVGLVLADSSVVVLALPQIYRELDTSVAGGDLGPRLLQPRDGARRRARRPPRAPRRPGRAAAIGLAVFAGAGLACGLSADLSTLIAARCVQALGGAAAVTAVLELLPATVGSERRARSSGRPPGPPARRSARRSAAS